MSEECCAGCGARDDGSEHRPNCLCSEVDTLRQRISELEQELKIERQSNANLYSENKQLKQELKEAREEKKRRVYYQDIVYRVCTALDVELRNSPGCGIVCGTAYNPNPTAVTDALSRALQQAEKRGFEAGAHEAADRGLSSSSMGITEIDKYVVEAWNDYLKAKRGEGDGKS